MNSTDDLDRRRPADTDESDLLPDEPSMKPETADEIRLETASREFAECQRQIESRTQKTYDLGYEGEIG